MLFRSQGNLTLTGFGVGATAAPVDYLALARVEFDNARVLADGGLTVGAIKLTKLQALQRRKQGKDAGYPWRAEVARTTVGGLTRTATGAIAITAVDLDGVIARLTNTATGLHGLELKPPSQPAVAAPPPPPPVVSAPVVPVPEVRPAPVAPVAAMPAICVLMRKTALSNSELAMRWPLPVASRSRSAAWIAMTPNIAPMMSITDAPARSGRPGGPVIHASPDWNCTTSSSAGRCS